MLSLLAEDLTEFIMSNHTYSVGNKIFLQIKGGPIGIDFTRVIARILMIVFDGRFALAMEEIEEVDMVLHKRYVDDENLALDVAFNDDDETTYEEVVETTSYLLQSIANQIYPDMFTVTVDNCNNHEDGKLPILDLKVWLDEEQNLRHEFYSKPVSYKGVVWASSGLPDSMKKQILINEGLRRVVNCSPELSWSHKAKFLDQMCLYMMQGGHKYHKRVNIIDAVIDKYYKLLHDHNNGIPMYRSRELMKKKKNKLP